MKQKKLTVVIAEHNEGAQLRETLESLYSTSDSSLYDVIVVSDGSEIDPQTTGNESHIRLAERSGVGAAFDVGAEHVRTPYMIIMGSDIRFLPNGYMDKMLAHLEDEENSKSFICAATIGINPQQMDPAKSKSKRYGARTLLFMSAKDLPSKGKEMGRLQDDKAVANYRNILESKWMPGKIRDEIYELPCLLGAFYGVRTDWYNHIMGFQGHRYWGTLEPFVSLKSWLAGGTCKCAPDVEVAHIFKGGSNRPSHVTFPYDLIYNKMAVATICFSDKVSAALINYLGVNADITVARELFSENALKIYALRDQFHAIREKDIYWYKEKFPFNDYGQL